MSGGENVVTTRMAFLPASAVIAVLAFQPTPGHAKTYQVADQAAYQAQVKLLQPGDELVLANGVWQDFQISFTGKGQSDKPITLKAETPGSVVLSGQSNLRIGGEHLIVSGLTFKDGSSPSGAVIEFQTQAGVRAHHSRLTETVIDGFSKSKRSDRDQWVTLFGQNNRVDHNYFAGKTNRGPTLIVRLNDEDSRNNQHSIDHNFFGHRPTLGGNGGETLRIGVSGTSRTRSQSLVTKNFFERCDGEVEIISLKSEGNTISENVFYESRGAVVFRHGGGNTVSRNIFLGNGVPDTGGVRIINENQTIKDNYFEGLRGEKFLSALTIMNGVPNSPINRYHQVSGADVSRNSFIDFVAIGLAVGSDEERSAAPIDSQVSDNLFITNASNPVSVFDDISGIRFSSNVSNAPAMKAYGAAVKNSVGLERADNGLLYPVDPASSKVGAPRDLDPVKRDATGPGWYEKPPQSVESARSVTVKEGGKTLAQAVAQSQPGDVLRLLGQRYDLKAPLKIAHKITVMGKPGQSTRPALRSQGASIFVMTAGGDLTLKNVEVIGSKNNTAIIAARGDVYKGSYALALSNVGVARGNSVEDTAFLAADTATFATLIDLDNVSAKSWPGPFIALSGAGLEGTYLAEDVRIRNSTFTNLSGPLITFGRDGRDESTFGPRVTVETNTLVNVNPKGSAILLGGVDGLVFERNRFENSGSITVKKRVLGQTFSFQNNSLEKTSAPKIFGVNDPLEDTEPVIRPSLILTAEAVEDIKAAKGDIALFDAARDEAIRRVGKSLREGVVVPIPKDPGGGYTHERHKENYKVIHDAGLLYQLTGEEKYLEHAKALLLAYANIYTDLPLHSAKKNQNPGKLFWQNLNESVWLVYAIQGFDAIAAGLLDADRTRIENDLLRPAADFLSLESPTTFRKIHNHGTWAAAAVGMTGYALKDEALVKRALLGLDGDGSSGFLAQLDQLFSPDGYYTEGPYYQRYALMPFVVFAQAIDNNEPERKIFKHRDGILLKAIDATIQQSYAGKFFPLNDAIKSKGLDTQELVYAAATAYALTGRDDLLSVAQYQGKTVLSGPGLAVAKAAAKSDPADFAFRTMLLRDGQKGDQGALAILRMGGGALAQTVLVKNTSQGFGHGHFDKLAITLFDGGHEILSDYGAARFLNVPTKEGGRYLPENNSWAKQTIAHNTLVLNETSQFGGDWRVSQKYWPTLLHFQAGDALNVVSAELWDAYPGAKITRTLVQLKSDKLGAPILLDILRTQAEEAATFDLPFYAQAQLVDFKGTVKKSAMSLSPLGEKHGYQHLWVQGIGAPKGDHIAVSWLKDTQFYTLHTLAPQDTKPVFVRLGANDPNFNLRPEQGVILRAPKAKSATFVSIFEPHGTYNTKDEFTVGSETQILSMEHASKDGRDLVILTLRGGGRITVVISHNPSAKARHKIQHEGRSYRWRGFIDVLED